jgi:hypothetical protein
MPANPLLKPYLDLVAIWVRDIGEGIAWRELTLTKDFASCMLNLGHCERDIFWPLQAEPEVLNAADHAGAGRCTLKRKYIERAWALT